MSRQNFTDNIDTLLQIFFYFFLFEYLVISNYIFFLYSVSNGNSSQIKMDACKFSSGIIYGVFTGNYENVMGDNTTVYQVI